jgi:hypothetical protein
LYLIFLLLRSKTASQSSSSAALLCTPMQMPYIGSC